MMKPSDKRKNDSYGAIAFAEGEAGPVVLMVRAREGWSFPKGHHEKGESPAQCAERETMEETGIAVKVNTAFVGAAPDANGETGRTVRFFIATSTEGDKLPVADEVTEAEWVPVAEAAERILFAPDRKIFEDALAFLARRKNVPAPKHILISAERHTGKTTLIRRLLKETDLPVYGFITKSGTPDPKGFHDIHIHPAGQPEEERTFGKENQIGSCDTVHHIIDNDVFNNVGAPMIAGARPGGLIVMDELGFMERDAEVFKTAVYDALTGDIPVLATIKTRYDVAFLNELRALPKVAVYDLTEQNRDDLFEELKPLIKALPKA